jgi:uncharacterized membrane protein
MLWLLAIYLLGGVLLCLLSVPLIQRRIPRNGLYGFRVAKTMASDAVWFPANEFAGKRLLVVGLVIAAVAIVLFAVPAITLDAYALSVLLVTVVAFTVTTVQCVRFLQSLPEDSAKP